jgi:hypothetical protein
MDILQMIGIFLFGFALGAFMTSSGGTVRYAKLQSQADAAFREGWWAGLQDARASTGKTPVERPAPAPAAPKVAQKRGVN